MLGITPFQALVVLLCLTSPISARKSYVSRSGTPTANYKHSVALSGIHKKTPKHNDSTPVSLPSFLPAPYLQPDLQRSDSFLPPEHKRDSGTYLGCYYDSSSSRVLSIGPYTVLSSLTTATCVQYCEGNGYTYAGTEYGVECWCGTQINSAASVAPAEDCSQTCSGDSSEICGNSYRLSLYETGSSTSTTSSSSSSAPSYTYLGCYTDSSSSRVLSSGPTTYSSLTTEICMSQCSSQGYSYGGTEYGQECWCGDSVASSASEASASDCSQACNGSSQETCGNNYKISLYKLGTSSTTTTDTTTATTTAATVTSTSTSSYSYLGCYVDSSSSRVLSDGPNTSPSLTTESCTASCASQGYLYAGTEYGQECWCGNSIASTATVASVSDCSEVCDGNANEICGNSYRISLYQLSSSTTTTTTSVPTSTAASTYTYLGCYYDSTSSRVLSDGPNTSSSLTTESCIAQCASQGYLYTGTEYGQECWCGDSVSSDASVASSTDCSQTCTGNSQETCGNGNRISLYKITSSSTTTTTTTSTATSSTSTATPSGWSYMGCYQDSTSSRVLTFGPSTSSSLTAKSCLNSCYEQDYVFGGMEYGQECWCGNSLSSSVVEASAGDCSQTCTGDATQTCGNGNRLSLYSYTGGYDSTCTPATSTVASTWYAGWHSSYFPLSSLSWSKYTSVIYSFATPTSYNTVSLDDSDASLLPEFVAMARQNNVKAILSIGGWSGSVYFSSAVASSSARTTFANSVLSIVSSYDLDGVEFDWEYPGTQGAGNNIVSSNDAGNFVLFLQTLKSMAPSSMTISVAVTGWLWTGLTSANVASMAAVLDHIELMNYDLWGSWSGLVGPNAPLADSCSSYPDGSATSALQTWTSAGFPASKIILGVASYGHSFYVPTSSAYSSSSGQTTIAQYPAFDSSNQPQGDAWDNAQPYTGVWDFWGLVDDGWLSEQGVVSEGIDYRFDTCSKTPYLYNPSSDDMVSYDDAASFAAKGSWITENGLAGFAMWEAAGDYNDILLNSIKTAIC